MMLLAFLYSPGFGYLCLLLWDIQPIAAMETSSGANVSHPPATVVTITRGGFVDLHCRLPREIIAQNEEAGWSRNQVQWYRTPGPAGARNETYGQVEGAAAVSLSSRALPSRFFRSRDRDTLRIVPVAVEDESIYFCVLTLEQKEFWGNGTELRVLAMETSTGVYVSWPPPTVVTIPRGVVFLLPCRVPMEWITQNDGVHWYRSPDPPGERDEPYGWVAGATAIDLSEPSGPYSRFSLMLEGISSVIPKASLRIQGVEVEDVGVYFCVVTFRQKLFWGNGTELRVLAMETCSGAKIMKVGPAGTTKVNAIRGGSIVLPCRIPRELITQKYRVQWFYMGKRGEQPLEISNISSPAFPPRFSLAEDKASLWIAPVAEEDTGGYVCTINVRQSHIIGDSSTLLGEGGPGPFPFGDSSRLQDPGERGPGPVPFGDVSRLQGLGERGPGPVPIGDSSKLQDLGMETSGGANVSRPPPTVVTVLRGVNVVLPCRVPREWITQNGGVNWHRTPDLAGVRDEPYGWPGELAPISSSALTPRFSHAPSASLRIEAVAVEDEGVYVCVMTSGQKQFWGNGTKLRVVAPPSAPQLFLQAPPDLWSGQWNLFCVTRGFRPNQVRLSWTQNGAESELEDCTPGSADPGPVQSNGSVWQNLILEDDCPPSVSLAMEAKPHPHQRCIYVNDSSGRGPYLVSVLPLSLGPDAGVNYTCAVHDHPALLTAQSASFKWESRYSEVIQRLNIIKICFFSGVALVFAIVALSRQFKKRAMSPLT